MVATTPEAYRLFHDGVIALAQVEANGIRIDRRYLRDALANSKEEIRKRSKRLEKSRTYKVWHRAYGAKTNLGSPVQRAKVLFEIQGHPSFEKTATGKPKTDEANLKMIDDPFVRELIKIDRLKKARNTFLKGIADALQGEFLHPFFHLHTVRTFRGSSSDPNFQNFPLRDPVQGELIRRAFIPRKGHCFIEVDFKGAEVCVAACYNHDPNMIRYIKDGYDYHKELAAECYCCKPDQVSKEMRYAGKNRFTFAQFYGSYYKQCAPTLWRAIEEFDLKVGDVPIKEHLASNGIREFGNLDTDGAPGTFLHNIKKVEDRFWNKRFRGYRDWKEKWVQDYLDNGGFMMKTGFYVRGYLKKNDVTNYPIQGSAFHCLLWCLIEIQRQLNRRKMKSRIVGQIHDSILADVHKKERKAYIRIAKEVITQRLPEAWEWIIVPITVEAEMSTTNWWEKKEIEI